MGSSYTRDVKKILRANGCSCVRRGKGSHEIWYSPISERYFTVVIGCKNRHTANGILKDAGVAERV
ncbi:MAG: type II toxin-antitoxin system HicA family toxin [Proteobacteria bacterium]|nr:type II toxin-antitoxin system HicA family toxin [Pseudomonadota bacterium]